jgi:hypothetical protein
MVAIQIPVLESTAPLYNHSAKHRSLDYKMIFLLRALNVCDKVEDDRTPVSEQLSLTTDVTKSLSTSEPVCWLK